jgi:hypothetical protein
MFYPFLGVFAIYLVSLYANQLITEGVYVIVEYLPESLVQIVLHYQPTTSSLPWMMAVGNDKFAFWCGSLVR